jgi:DNA-binding NtrC family response regulator
MMNRLMEVASPPLSLIPAQYGQKQRGGRILLVDSQISRRSLLEWLLRKEKYEVILANSLWNAYELFELDRFQMVIAAHQMPYLNALQLIERMKQVEPELPILVFVPEGNEEIREKAMAEGAIDCLGMPMDYTLFLRLIASSAQRAS